MNKKYIQKTKMLKNIVKIQYNSDFTLNCKLPNGYDNQDFIIRLYTTDKDNYYEASYLNGEYENCLTDSENNNIVIYVNNHNLQPGCLHIGMQFDYDNTHFADNVENIITAEETNVYLVKQNANATSAMYVGSALPDLTGSVDFITQSDLEFELLNYYTKEDIDNASYISSADLNNYVTEEELNDMGFLSAAQLETMGYATTDYVDTKTGIKQDRLISGVNIKTVNGYSLLGNGNVRIDTITQNDLDNAVSGLVTQESLNEELSEYVTTEDLETMDLISAEEISEMGFITQSQLSSNSYATQNYVDTAISNIQPVDMSSYVTKTELSNAGYATTSDLNTAISGINVPTKTSDLTNDSGFITSIPAEYVTQSELSAMSYATTAQLPNMNDYVSKTELNNASYITQSELNNMSYATTNDLNTAISGITVPTKTSDLTNDSGFITSIPAEYITQTELESELVQYVTESEIAAMSYVTQSELSAMSYATTSQLPNMNDYVSHAELNNASYVSKTELNNASYATTSQLSNKQDTLVSGTNIKTVNNQSLLGSGNITIQGGSSISEVTQAQYDAMEQAGTLDSNVIYIITDAPTIDFSYYVLQSDLENMGYATETYVSDYVAQHAPTPDLSSYVTKTELSNAGYLTSIPNTYATYSAISAMGYITMSDVSAQGYMTGSQISQMGYITSSDLSGLATEQYVDTAISGLATEQYVDTAISNIQHVDMSSYVTKTELSNASYATQNYVDTAISNIQPVDMSSYVTKTDLSNAGYITSIPAEYVTESEIAGMGYITMGDVSTCGYITSSDIPTIPVIDESIVPKADATYMLGDASHMYRYAYIQTLRSKSEGFTLMLGGAPKYDFYGSAFRPRGNKSQNLGSSNYQWAYTYSANFIENGTNIKDIYTQTEVVTQNEYDALTTEQKNSETIYVISDQQEYYDNEIVTEQSLATRGFLTAANFIYDPTTGALTLNL